MPGKYETKPNVNMTGGLVGKYWARGYRRRKRGAKVAR